MSTITFALILFMLAGVAMDMKARWFALTLLCIAFLFFAAAIHKTP